MNDIKQTEKDNQAASAAIEEAVARAIIAEIFAGVPEPHRPATTADMPEEQAMRFRAAARAAIVASLSAGKPDGMETSEAERKVWSEDYEDKSFPARFVRDFDRLLAREAKAREEVAALANQWARNWEAAAAAGLLSGEATTADFLDQFAAAVRGTS